MAPEEQPIALEAYEYVLQAKYHQQQQNEAAFQIQVLIETLYKTIESLTTENIALQEENEAIQTQVKDLKQNCDHRMKQKRGVKKFGLQGAKEGIADQNQNRHFLKMKKFWEKKNVRLQKDENEKQEDLNVCDMAVGSTVVKEEALGEGKQHFKKQMPRSHTKKTSKKNPISLEGGKQVFEKEKLSHSSSYPETIDLTDDEQPSTTSFQGRAEVSLDMHRFWEVTENETFCEGTSYREKENSIKEDMSIAEEEIVNIDEFNEQEAEELKAFKTEFEALEAMVLEQQASNMSLKSDAEQKEDDLEQHLREKRAELETLVVRNMYLINDIDKERETSDALNATIGDLEDQCGRVTLKSFLERKKRRPKDRRSSRERQLEQWEANRWGDD
ncbi:uncharacterized protein LOC121904635 isoform X2 [Scomber scombrus]|uniref:Uncharacterized protein LOC121904635 isoform X2 n=1 Tax=Scomber scombrus TaxID=13677 RepID=A0AAV1N1A4_SCOSC